MLQSYIKLADAGYDDDMLAPLNSLYVAKSAGKEVILDVESLGSALVSSTGAAAVVTAETWMAYLALETLLAVVSDIESLTDMVVDNDPELPSPSCKCGVRPISVAATLEQKTPYSKVVQCVCHLACQMLTVDSLSGAHWLPLFRTV